MKLDKKRTAHKNKGERNAHGRKRANISKKRKKE